MDVVVNQLACLEPEPQRPLPEQPAHQATSKVTRDATRQSTIRKGRSLAKPIAARESNGIRDRQDKRNR